MRCGDIDFAEEHALQKGAARGIAEHFADDAEAVDGTCHAGVCGADHGDFVFDAAENGVVEVLNRAGAFEEPSIICDDHEGLRAEQSEATRQIGNCVFKTNKRSEFHGLRLKLEDGVFFSSVEV